MFLKKIIPELEQALSDLEYHQAMPLQKKAIPIIKSGHNSWFIAPKQSGKSTTLAISIVQQLKKAVNDVPRAIVITPDKASAIALKETFDTIAQYTDLRIFTIVEGEDTNLIKHRIYVGSDILIGTVKRLNELYSASGINLNDLRIFAVDDIHKVLLNDPLEKIDRWREILQKAQYIMFTEQYTERIQRFVGKWGLGQNQLIKITE